MYRFRLGSKGRSLYLLTYLIATLRSHAQSCAIMRSHAQPVAGGQRKHKKSESSAVTLHNFANYCIILLTITTIYAQIFLDLHSMLVCAVMAYTLHAAIVRNISFDNLYVKDVMGRERSIQERNNTNFPIISTREEKNKEKKR